MVDPNTVVRDANLDNLTKHYLVSHISTTAPMMRLFSDPASVFLCLDFIFTREVLAAHNDQRSKGKSAC